jgi:outer membrane biosynthesis protein TonB
MNCRKCRAELERFLDNELVPSERAIIEQHVAACAECRKRLSELLALNSVLETRSEVEPDSDYLSGFKDRFWHEVKRRRRMRAPESERRLLPVFWTRAGTLAAAALLLIAVGLVGYRSWHSFFEHPTADLSLPGSEASPAPEATGRTAGPKPMSQATEPGTPKPGPQAEEAKPAEPRPVKVQPTQTNPKAPSSGLGMKAASRGEERASGLKLEARQPAPSAMSASGQGAAGSRKGGLRLGEGTPAKKGGPSPGQVMGGVNAQAPDTVIYPEEKLDTKPVLVSIPDASDDDRMKYPGLEVPVWVVVERDGSVSRVESRSATANASLTGVALALARQAQFLPGKRAGNAVRAGKTIVVRIRALSRKND